MGWSGLPKLAKLYQNLVLSNCEFWHGIISGYILIVKVIII